MNGPLDPIQSLAMLADEIDAEFAAIQRRRTTDMNCRAGCTACCRARLSITRVEEAFVRRGLATLTEEQRDQLSSRTREAGREMCSALDGEGRCGIYAFRPLICRSSGAPLGRRQDVALVNPPVIDVCDLNFVDRSLKLLPAEDVFDQTDLIERLDEIDRDHCLRTGLPLRERVPLARILE
jgi:hypothetical protein